MFLLRDKLITQGEKRETPSTQNLQRNNVARQVKGFCISYFAAFSDCLQRNVNCLAMLLSKIARAHSILEG